MFDDLQRRFNEYAMIEPSISDQIHFKIIQNIVFGIQNLISDAKTDMQNENPKLQNVKIDRMRMRMGMGMEMWIAS